MGPLAAQPYHDRRRHRRPQSGYVCIAGEVDRAGEKDLTAALVDAPPCAAAPWSIDLGGVTFGGPALLNFLARWPRRGR